MGGKITLLWVFVFVFLGAGVYYNEGFESVKLLDSN